MSASQYYDESNDDTKPNDRANENTYRTTISPI